jgi:hypothetical protein
MQRRGRAKITLHTPRGLPDLTKSTPCLVQAKKDGAGGIIAPWVHLLTPIEWR